MTTKEAILDIVKRGGDASFQVKPVAVTLSSEEEFFSIKRSTPSQAEGRILKKFGERDWVRLDFKGYVPCYCPAEVAEEVRRVKQEVFDRFEKEGYV